MGPQWKHLAVFITTVVLCCECADEEQEAVKAREGATVTLNTTETSCHSNLQVVWLFGPEKANTRIASMKGREVRSNFSAGFRERLQVDCQTGALSISQLRVTDSGFYTCLSIGTTVFSQHFHLLVYSSVSLPSIKVNTSTNNACNGSVTAECFVENSGELILSWYRGGDRLTETSSPDLSSRLSLALEIESQDGDDYSCVAENPVEQKTTRLRTEDTCLRDGEPGSWCQPEATARLLVSAAVGMALIVLLVDHIRLTR